jgi:hypothetical protein
MDGIGDRRIKKRRDRSDQAMVQNTALVINVVATLLLAVAVKDSAVIHFVQCMLRSLRIMMVMRAMSGDERHHACDLGDQE